MQKDLRVLKILQKAREFNDSDLLNEDLLNNLINAEFKGISQGQKEQIAKFLNELKAPFINIFFVLEIWIIKDKLYSLKLYFALNLTKFFISFDKKLNLNHLSKI